jgi:esterase/lipase
MRQQTHLREGVTNQQRSFRSIIINNIDRVKKNNIYSQTSTTISTFYFLQCPSGQRDLKTKVVSSHLICVKDEKKNLSKNVCIFFFFFFSGCDLYSTRGFTVEWAVD